MHRRVLTGERLLAAFLGGCVLFNYPLLSLFDRGSELFGIPLLYVYVFAAWAGLIALMAWFIERRSE
jgi:predicted permease